MVKRLEWNFLMARSFSVKRQKEWLRMKNRVNATKLIKHERGSKSSSSSCQGGRAQQHGAQLRIPAQPQSSLPRHGPTLASTLLKQKGSATSQGKRRWMKYWVGRKVCSCFSVRCYEKPERTFQPTQYDNGLRIHEDFQVQHTCYTRHS